MLSSSRCIDASMLSSMLASPLLPSFLDTYRRSTSSLGYNALCTVISFLVFWSICFRSLVHFKNGPKYLTRGTVQLFIPLIRFLLHSFLVLLGYSFFIFFFHLHLFDSVSFQYFQVFIRFLFSGRFNFFLILVVPFRSSCVASRFSLLAWRIFQCQIPSLCPDFIFSWQIV